MRGKARIFICFTFFIVTLFFCTVHFKTDVFAVSNKEVVKVTSKANFETIYDNDQGVIYLMLENTSEESIKLKSIKPILPDRNSDKLKDGLKIEPIEEYKDEGIPANKTIKIAYKLSTDKIITPGKDSVFFDIEFDDGSNNLYMIDINFAVAASDDILSLLGVPSFMLLPGLVFVVIFILILKIKKVDFDTSLVESKSIIFWLVSISLSIFISFIYSKSEMLSSISIINLFYLAIALLLVYVLKSRIVRSVIPFEKSVDSIINVGIVIINLALIIAIIISIIKQDQTFHRNIFKTYGLSDIMSTWLVSFIAAMMASSVFICYKNWYSNKTTFSVESDRKAIKVIEKLSKTQNSLRLSTVISESPEASSTSTWFILQEKTDYVIICQNMVLYKNVGEYEWEEDMDTNNMSKILKSVREGRRTLNWNEESLNPIRKIYMKDKIISGYKRTGRIDFLIEKE